MVERTIRIMDSAIDTNKLAAGAVIGADIANQTLTAAKASTTDWLMVGRSNSVAGGASTLIEWEYTTSSIVTLTATPKVILQVVGNSAGTTVNVTSISTSSCTVYPSHTCTLDWLCLINLS
jgi:hypothetical protein